MARLGPPLLFRYRRLIAALCALPWLGFTQAKDAKNRLDDIRVAHPFALESVREYPVQNPQRPFRGSRSRRRPAYGLIEARGKVTHALARGTRALHLTD